MPGGFSLRIFLPDGSPDGLRLVEKSNWTGRGIVCPRPLFPAARTREEFSRTGVYVLLGPPGEGELATAIAEAKAAKDRDQLAVLRRELADYDKRMAETIATESRALLKQRFDYPVFLYEAEKVGISATGEPDLNELYPNDRVPAGLGKTCLELYREFRQDPAPFFVHGLAA